MQLNRKTVTLNGREARDILGPVKVEVTDRGVLVSGEIDKEKAQRMLGLERRGTISTMAVRAQTDVAIKDAPTQAVVVAGPNGAHKFEVLLPFANTDRPFLPGPGRGANHVYLTLRAATAGGEDGFVLEAPITVAGGLSVPRGDAIVRGRPESPTLSQPNRSTRAFPAAAKKNIAGYHPWDKTPVARSDVAQIVELSPGEFKLLIHPNGFDSPVKQVTVGGRRFEVEDGQRVALPSDIHATMGTLTQFKVVQFHLEDGGTKTLGVGENRIDPSVATFESIPRDFKAAPKRMEMHFGAEVLEPDPRSKPAISSRPRSYLLPEANGNEDGPKHIGQLVAQGYPDGTLRLFDPETGKQLSASKLSNHPVAHIEFQNGGTQLMVIHAHPASEKNWVATWLDLRDLNAAVVYGRAKGEAVKKLYEAG